MSPIALSRCNSKGTFLKSFSEKFSVDFSSYFSLENLLAVVIYKMMNGGGRSIIQQSQKNSHFSCQENFSTSSRCRGISSIGIITIFSLPNDIFFLDELKLSQLFNPLQKSMQTIGKIMQISVNWMFGKLDRMLEIQVYFSLETIRWKLIR